MKFWKKIFFSSFLIVFSSFLLRATGGGLILYRYDNGGTLLFLMALDPYQTSAVRQGFEFPAGTICDHSIDDCDDVHMIPKDFLRGAIREGMEELVFAPVVHSTLGIPGVPYDVKTKKINQNYENLVIDVFQKEILKQGMVYLFKQRINPKFNAVPRNQLALFFCDLTSFYKDDLLEKIIEQRLQLKNNGFSFHVIGAEPNQFAWVKGSDLKALILCNSKPYQVNAVEHIDDAKRIAKNKIIILSDACFGMIRDRTGDPHNHQLNVFNQDRSSSSSMLTVIDYLLTSKKLIPTQVVAPKKVEEKYFLDDFIKKLNRLDSEIEKIIMAGEQTYTGVLNKLNLEQEYKDLVLKEKLYSQAFHKKTQEIFQRCKVKLSESGCVFKLQKLIAKVKNLFY